MIFLKKKFFNHIFYAFFRKLYTNLFWIIPSYLPVAKHPYIFGLELTNNCNLDCIHCFGKVMNKNHGYMNFNLFKKFIDEISTYPYAFLIICGRGEPSLHPELNKLMDYLTNKKQIKVEFVTNGTLFEKYSFQDILSWNIDLLSVSVDGLDKKSYNRIRKKGNYDRLKKNITNFYNFKITYKRNSPKVQIRNVVFPGSKSNQIKEFRKNWHNISDLVTLNRLSPIDNSVQDLKDYNRCKGYIFFSAYPRWDGQIPICQHHGRYINEIYIGDLNKEHLVDIWKNPELQKLRLLHYKKNFKEFPACKYCYATNGTSKRKYHSKFQIPKNKKVLSKNPILNFRY